MEPTDVIFLLLLFLRPGLGAPLEYYVSTQGAMPFSLTKRQLEARSIEDCASRCEAETGFTCRSFQFHSKEQQCVIMAENSRLVPVTRATDVILFEKKVYVSGCKTGNGRTYRGTMNMTKSGLTCQKWGDHSPHRPNYSPERFPSAGLEENYCRNPDDDDKGPWCYTMDPDVRFDYCDVPQCEGCKIGNGRTYRGTINMTKSGLACQKWGDHSPHRPKYSPEQYPSEGLEENYCRNPDDDEGPWCYTMDPDVIFDYCDIPQCKDSTLLNFRALSSPTCNDTDGECIFKRTEKECKTGNGRTYRGTVSTTESGLTCQKWSDFSPHRPNYSPERFPSAGLEENYCRNPDDDDEGPWCYTMDPDVRFDYCDIPQCEECKTGNGRTYRGTVSTTKSGLTCQKWSDYSPHRPNYFPERFPSAGLEENYCRNPDDDDKGPWCYTMDPDVRFDYCDVPQCEDSDLLTLQALQMTTCDGADEKCLVRKARKECMTENGRTYRGTVSMTKSGLTCQKWSDRSPHRPNYSPDEYPSEGLEENYCRNPDDDDEGPWCYTMDPNVRFDYCDVPQCEGQESSALRIVITIS